MTVDLIIRRETPEYQMRHKDAFENLSYGAQQRIVSKSNMFHVDHFANKPYLYYRYEGIPIWALFHIGGEQIVNVENTVVNFRVLPPSEVKAFVDSVYTSATHGPSGYKVLYRYIVDTLNVLGVSERFLNDYNKRTGVSKQITGIAKTYTTRSFRPTRPLEQFQMDTALVKVPVGYAKGLKDSQFIILTIVDIFSKRLWVRRIPNTKRETIQNILEDVFLSGEVPQKLQTDNAAEFRNTTFKEFLDKYQVELIINPSYRPQANGIVERNHKTFKDRLYASILMEIKAGRSTIEQSMLDWKISEIVYSLNTTRHSVTKLTPFQVHYGVFEKKPLEISNTFANVNVIPSKEVYAEYLENLEVMRERRYDAVREIIDINAQKTEAKYMRTGGVNFAVGDTVKVALLFKGPKGYNNIEIVSPITRETVEGRHSTTAMRFLDRRFVVETWSEKTYVIKCVLKVGNVIRVYLHSEDEVPVLKKSEWTQTGGFKYEEWFPDWSLDKMNLLG